VSRLGSAFRDFRLKSSRLAIWPCTFSLTPTYYGGKISFDPAWLGLDEKTPSKPEDKPHRVRLAIKMLSPREKPTGLGP